MSFYPPQSLVSYLTPAPASYGLVWWGALADRPGRLPSVPASVYHKICTRYKLLFIHRETKSTYRMWSSRSRDSKNGTRWHGAGACFYAHLAGLIIEHKRVHIQRFRIHSTYLFTGMGLLICNTMKLLIPRYLFPGSHCRRPKLISETMYMYKTPAGRSRYKARQSRQCKLPFLRRHAVQLIRSRL